MKSIPQSGKGIQWFELAILAISMLIIGVAVNISLRQQWNDAESLSGGASLGALDERSFVQPGAALATRQKLAEEALLANLSLSYVGNEHARQFVAKTDWASFGIPDEETKLFELWRNGKTDTLLTANDWLEQLLEIHKLYKTIDEALGQQVQDDEMFLGHIEELYRIPVSESRLHLLKCRPKTAGQWAMYVVQNRH